MANEHQNSPPAAHRVRSRAKKRNVAGVSVRAEWVDHDQVQFTTLQQHQLMVPLALSPSDETNALEELQDLAASYTRWRQTPQSSREVAKNDLLVLAHYCDEMIASRIENTAQLVCKVEQLDGLAETILWRRLRAREDWPEDRSAVHWLREEPAPAIVAEAARLGASCLKSGDYPDIDLHFAVAELIDIFERNTGQPAKAGRLSSATAICAVAYAFFDIVGEGETVEQNSIWNSLDKELRARRKKAHSTEGTS